MNEITAAFHKLYKHNSLNGFYKIIDISNKAVK